MIVVGGTYTETVTYPVHTSTLMGSGLRAASVLGSEVESLITLATSEESLLIKERHPDARVVERTVPVEFRYLDPALRPHVVGLPSKLAAPLVVEHPHSDVLAFGLAEIPEGYAITARRAVIDPQSPQTLDPDSLVNIRAEEIVLCLNRGEARRMTGKSDPEEAAAALLKLRDVKAVVVKCGALGHVVAGTGTSQWRHATPTPYVRSLGTGDVFSAIFAREWFGGAAPGDAAAVASETVAQNVSGIRPTTSVALPHRPGYAPKVYLAGPFFTLGERWLVERVRSILDALGARVFSPIHDVGPGGIEVAQQDLDGLDSCDAVLALLDGFDPGTIYETGWAAREKIPVVGFSSEPHAKETKMLVGMGAEVHTDLTSAMYRSIWAGQGLTLSPGVLVG